MSLKRHSYLFFLLQKIYLSADVFYLFVNKKGCNTQTHIHENNVYRNKKMTIDNA